MSHKSHQSHSSHPLTETHTAAGLTPAADERIKNMAEALGMIETRSFPAVVEAADAAVKAARVDLVGYEKTGGGYTTIIIRGDVAAVRAACDAAQIAAGRVGDVVAVHIIARPHANVDTVMPLGRADQARDAAKGKK